MSKFYITELYNFLRFNAAFRDVRLSINRTCRHTKTYINVDKNYDLAGLELIHGYKVSGHKSNDLKGLANLSTSITPSQMEVKEERLSNRGLNDFNYSFTPASLLQRRTYSFLHPVYNGSTTEDDVVLELLLQSNGLLSKNLTTNDKLNLLKIALNSKISDELISMFGTSNILLELWKAKDYFNQQERGLYSEICAEINKRIWNNTQLKTYNQKLYENQFNWEFKVLHNYHLSPTLEQYTTKQRLIHSLKPLLEKSTKGTLHTFGSCENGLWVRGSDIDMCLVIPNCNTKRHYVSKLNMVCRDDRMIMQIPAVSSAYRIPGGYSIIKLFVGRVESSLMNSDYISKVTLISARVPIAKLYNSEGENLCDVSINNSIALDNTSYVKCMTSLDYRVIKLGRFIKYWATCRKINNRHEGTMSSYTLILQLFYFLQNRNPPILPTFKEIETKPIEDRHLNFITDRSAIMDRCPYIGTNKESLVQLLFDFFRFYGGDRFQGGYVGVTIDIYTNELLENNLGVLVIKCPLSGKNVNPFTIRMWQSIYSEFKRFKQLIEVKAPIYSICKSNQYPPLEEELIKYKENANETLNIILYTSKKKHEGTTQNSKRITDNL